MDRQGLHHRLARLPLRAMAAFAARCARRVRPLADVLREDDRAKIDRAIAAAESAARGGYVNLARVVGSLAGKVADIDDIMAGARPHAAPAAGAARAASYAADTAAWLAATTADGTAADAGTVAKVTVLAAVDVTAAAGAAEATATLVDGTSAAADVGIAIRADVERLILLGLGEPGTHGSPIDPSEAGPLGPLWPGGQPAWLLVAAGEETPNV